MAWHDATCAALKLEWEDGRPGCLTCQRKAPAFAPIRPILPPEPPPDVPRSQLVCTWPPCLFSEEYLAESPSFEKDFNSDTLSFPDGSDDLDDSYLISSEDSDSGSSREHVEDDLAHQGNESVSSDDNERDSLDSGDILEDAKDCRDHGAQEENVKTLALICANIDEWTNSNTMQQSQSPLESTETDLERTLSSAELATSTQEVYTCLRNANSIRLLCLHGSAIENDHIHCTLYVHGLRDPSRPTFEALSYTWADSAGNSSLCEAIFVGPHYDVLPVTKNCLAALRCFRTAVDRLVWVDAICINQFDLQERSQQVSLMRDVYKSAARVLTYLGNGKGTLGDLTVLPYDNHRRSDNICTPSAADIRATLRLPYFSRIWVIQEVLLNESATLTAGKHTLHWQEFRKLARFSMPSRHSESILVQEDAGNREMSLFSWLQATDKCRCGDLRDRVYGLMGLSPGKDRKLLPVDYSISKQELYTGLAMYWLTRKGSYGSLISRVLDLAIPSKITSGLPSWAPDWTPQSRTDVSWRSTLVMPLILQINTKHMEYSSSGLSWPRLSRSELDVGPEVRWTLDKTIWGRLDDDGDNIFSWIGLARNVGWRSLASVQPLPLGGTLALEAFHILSNSTGRLELPDIKGRPLYGLQFYRDGGFLRKQQSHPRHEIHLYVSLDWQEGLALRKHADAVYSISNRFRVVCAPELDCFGHISKISMGLEGLVQEITRNWLLDVFFYGTGAGSAFVDPSRGSRVRKGWSDYFPRASGACEVLNSAFRTHTGEDHQHPTIAAMREIWQDAKDFVEETKCPLERKSNRTISRGLSHRDYRITENEDILLASCIQEVHAQKPETPTSSETLLLHFRNRAQDNRYSCKDYAPLQQALDDLDHSTRNHIQISSSGPFHIALWSLLIPDSVRVHGEKTVCLREAPLTIRNVMYIAWALLQDLKIDSKFTLEQNLSILWINVLTMQMVARLRGCLQQQLILKAFGDRMRKPQKIYLI